MGSRSPREMGNFGVVRPTEKHCKSLSHVRVKINNSVAETMLLTAQCHITLCPSEKSATAMRPFDKIFDHLL